MHIWINTCLYICVCVCVHICTYNLHITSSKSGYQGHTAWASGNWVLIAAPQITFSMILAKSCLFLASDSSSQELIEISEASSSSKITWFLRLLLYLGSALMPSNQGRVSVSACEMSSLPFGIYRVGCWNLQQGSLDQSFRLIVFSSAWHFLVFRLSVSRKGRTPQFLVWFYFFFPKLCCSKQIEEPGNYLQGFEALSRWGDCTSVPLLLCLLAGASHVPRYCRPGGYSKNPKSLRVCLAAGFSSVASEQVFGSDR